MRGRIKYDRDGNRTCFINDREVTQEEFDAAFPAKPMGVPGGHSATCWPMRSEALAVHPDQIEEATADAKHKGVPTRFDRIGRPILTDRGHRKAYMKAYGFHDNQGGYGD